MGIKAKETKIQSLFKGDFIFQIPNYQRPYSWGVEQTDDLMDDLLEAFHKKQTPNSDYQYFLGSIILIKNESRKKYEVIDG